MSNKAATITPRVWKARKYSGDGYDTYGKRTSGRYYCDINEAVKLETELLDAQKEIKELRKRNAALLTSLRKFSKYGTGPCGGGGTVDMYAQGRSATADHIRKMARDELKKYGTI
jgi:hypothetical protein